MRGTKPFNMFKQISEIAFNTLRFEFFMIFLAAAGVEFANKINVFFTLLTLAGVLIVFSDSRVAIFHARPYPLTVFHKVLTSVLVYAFLSTKKFASFGKNESLTRYKSGVCCCRINTKYP